MKDWDSGTPEIDLVESQTLCKRNGALAIGLSAWDLSCPCCLSKTAAAGRDCGYLLNGNEFVRYLNQTRRCFGSSKFHGFRRDRAAILSHPAGASQQNAEALHVLGEWLAAHLTGLHSAICRSFPVQVFFSSGRVRLLVAIPL